MTKDELKKRLNTYKRDNARLQIAKLRLDKAADTSEEKYSKLVSELAYPVEEISILLNSLKETDYTLINYKFLEGYTESEIVDKLLIGESTIYRHSNRILEEMLDIANLNIGA